MPDRYMVADVVKIDEKLIKSTENGPKNQEIDQNREIFKNSDPKWPTRGSLDSRYVAHV